VSGVEGDLSGVWGDLSDVRGNLSGVRGNLSGVCGNIDDCDILHEERMHGVDVSDLIGNSEDE